MTLTNFQQRSLMQFLAQLAPDTAHLVLARLEQHLGTRLRAQLGHRDMLQDDAGDATALTVFIKAQMAVTAAEYPRDGNRRAVAPTANERRRSNDWRRIVELNDDQLDILLAMAPAALTVELLSCSPQQFVQRVLSRLVDDQAAWVASQLSNVTHIEVDAMTEILCRYCALIDQLMDQGKLPIAATLPRTDDNGMPPAGLRQPTCHEVP